ncbi:UTRA domain-containing protein [Streptomyces sp. NPDC001852]|uniref:UTRA domain-containing protein n=1 Tax=Streptomyces sp. NPDC001852 TaxID=3364619 RepID=UPI0036AAB3AB
MCVERIREPAANGTVVSYERRYPPPVPVIRGLPARGLGEEALTGLLLRAGLRPDHGEQRVSGRPVDAREAELPRRAPGDWFLETRRTRRAADGFLGRACRRPARPRPLRADPHLRLIHHARPWHTARPRRPEPGHHPISR